MTIHSDDPEYWAIADSVRAEEHGGVMVGVSDHICRRAVADGVASRPVVISYSPPSPSHEAAFSDAPFRVIFARSVIEEQKRFSLRIGYHG